MSVSTLTWNSRSCGPTAGKRGSRRRRSRSSAKTAKSCEAKRKLNSARGSIAAVPIRYADGIVGVLGIAFRHGARKASDQARRPGLPRAGLITDVQNRRAAPRHLHRRREASRCRPVVAPPDWPPAMRPSCIAFRRATRRADRRRVGRRGHCHWRTGGSTRVCERRGAGPTFNRTPRLRMPTRSATAARSPQAPPPHQAPGRTHGHGRGGSPSARPQLRSRLRASHRRSRAHS